MTKALQPQVKKAKRRKHTKDFKHKAIRLAERTDVGFARAVKDLGGHESLLRSWLKARRTEDADSFRGQGKKSALEVENARLLCDNRTLTEDLEILKKRRPSSPEKDHEVRFHRGTPSAVAAAEHVSRLGGIEVRLLCLSRWARRLTPQSGSCAMRPHHGHLSIEPDDLRQSTNPP